MFKRNKGKNQYHVYITTNTYRGMILEVGRHPNNESIIQMPGLRIGNNFYFDVVSDSGINAIYTPTCCEKDHVYADHLSTRIAENYDFSKGKMTVSQVHRHPDGCIHFSSGDFEANSNLAKQYGGVVNGLMFVDPEFRLKFWYIDENGKETEAEYEINDRAVMEAMPFVEIEKIKSEVEKREALKKTCENDKLDEDMDFAISIEDMNAKSDDYIMPDSASRYLELADIGNLDDNTLQMIIYEIYARHGHEFIVQKNMDYFKTKEWYTSIPGKTDLEIYSEFNEYERANVKFLKQQLKERKG